MTTGAGGMREAPIELAAYDPAWPTRFVAEAALLRERLAPWLAGEIEHVGSTAVPGLCAKPVIDIMAPVRSVDDSRPAIETLRDLDYVHFPYLPHEMHWFCKPSPALRTHHLHLVPLGSPRWQGQLAFRDALRADAALAAQYAALKQRLARCHRDDREAYTLAKGPFIAEAIGNAAKP